MIYGVGTDLANVDRIKQAFDKFGDSFLKRICTATEILELQSRGNFIASLTKKFAAKEACSKALGTGFSGGVSWQDIEVLHHESGRPYINLSGQALKQLESKNINIQLSLSDDKPYAIAFVIIETF